jgi:hypothetical protein
LLYRIDLPSGDKARPPKYGTCFSTVKMQIVLPVAKSKKFIFPSGGFPFRK